MTPNEQRFAEAYLAWKMRYAEDVEPRPSEYGLGAQVGEAIARAVHRQFEQERVKRATTAAKCKCK